MNLSGTRSNDVGDNDSGDNESGDEYEKTVN